MSRASIMAALVFAVVLAGSGCQGYVEEYETVSSTLTGGGGAGPVPTVGSPVRGYAVLNSTGTSETHAAVYRSPTNGNVIRRTGTPLGAVTNLGGNMWMDSAPWGYLRADGVEAVLYIDVNRHVHEVRRSGTTFIDLDFTSTPINAPLTAWGQQNGPLPDAIGYVRTGLKSAVIYRDSNNHVIELLHTPGANPAWVASDLTVLSGSQFIVGKGSAFPYARSDGYNTVVYVANDGHIHELATFATPGSGTGTWGDYDLTAVTGTFSQATSDPWGYRRSDNCNAVLYASDGALHELALCPGSGWGYGLLPAVSPLGGLHRRPSGYIRADGVNAVVYVGSDASIHELALTGGGWVDSVIPVPDVIQISQLFGHRAPGNRSSILFRGLRFGFAHGYELSMPSGGNWNLQEF